MAKSVKQLQASVVLGSNTWPQSVWISVRLAHRERRHEAANPVVVCTGLFKAKLDTGSNTSIIGPAALRAIQDARLETGSRKPSIISRRSSTLADGRSDMYPVYDVGVILRGANNEEWPDSFVFFDDGMMYMPRHGEYDVLLGMDILRSVYTTAHDFEGGAVHLRLR